MKVEGRDISPTLLRQIAKDIGLSVEDFLASKATQQPDKVPSSAGDTPASQKPSKPGRG